MLYAMSSAHIYLDESGDLGWKFDKPYRQGGSSRFLTIAALVVPSNSHHLPKRLVRDLYAERKWNPKKEKKWSQMKHSARKNFTEKAKKLANQSPDIGYHSITVKKENVQTHIRQDGNKIYNYMTKLLLAHEMAKFDFVSFMPDPKSIKVESGNSLHDYLQTHLWFELRAKTTIETIPTESSNNLNIQFADMLSGLVQTHYEDRNSECWNIINRHINFKKLYFG